VTKKTTDPVTTNPVENEPSEGASLSLSSLPPPSTASAAKTTRLNLDLSDVARARLDALRVFLTASSLTDVIRRALALLQAIAENEKAGGQTILRDKKGKETRVVIF